MTEYNPGPEFRKSSGYGNRPHPHKPGETEFHTGIDFKARIGTPIPAASDGEVVYSQFNKTGGFGNTVIIRSEGADGEVYFTQYSHMAGPGAAFGTKVRAGQVIGQVGNTGLSTGPHVHFELLRGNAPVNKRNDPNDSSIGFTTKLENDHKYRHDPTQFDNWAGGAPYDGLSGEAPAAEPGQVPLPRPRSKIGEFLPDYRGAVPPLENRYSPASAADDNNRLAPLNPKPLTPDISRLGAWPQPPFPAREFFPQTPNGIVNDRFYFDPSRSPAPLPPQSAPPTPPPSPALNAPNWLDPYAPRLDWLPPSPRGANSSDTSRSAAASSAGDWLGLQRSEFGAFEKLPRGGMGRRSDLAPSGGGRVNPSSTNPLISMGLLRSPLDGKQAPVPMQVTPTALSPEPADPSQSPSPEPEAAAHWLDGLASPPLSPSDAPPWLDPEAVGKGLRRLLGLPE